MLAGSQKKDVWYVFWLLLGNHIIQIPSNKYQPQNFSLGQRGKCCSCFVDGFFSCVSFSFSFFLKLGAETNLMVMSSFEFFPHIFWHAYRERAASLSPKVWNHAFACEHLSSANFRHCWVQNFMPNRYNIIILLNPFIWWFHCSSSGKL